MKTLRVIRTITVADDVPLTSYHDGPADDRRYWSAEEAIAYERARSHEDKLDDFNRAIGSHDPGKPIIVETFVVIDDGVNHTAPEVLGSHAGAIIETLIAEEIDERTDAEHAADAQDAAEHAADTAQAVFMFPPVPDGQPARFKTTTYPLRSDFRST